MAKILKNHEIRESIKEFIAKYPQDNITAVECGVFFGVNAINLYKMIGNKLNTLYLIDSWRIKHNIKAPKAMLKVVELFEEDDTVCIIRHLAEKAVELFKNNSLDYVYIDDNHMSSHVYPELNLWLPKVKIGGMLAGHDYPQEHKNGVAKAVDSFITKHNLQLFYRENQEKYNPNHIGDWWIWKK